MGRFPVVWAKKYSQNGKMPGLKAQANRKEHCSTYPLLGVVLGWSLKY